MCVVYCDSKHIPSNIKITNRNRLSLPFWTLLFGQCVFDHLSFSDINCLEMPFV